ncbi:MAG: NAD(P)-binding domain-containing protein [Chloroflexi bacterium]|nr:NAD(P)-binding domain-containing protein [Chloroflexota bacterium]MCY3696448.1 NAD(P)-binding domain-containing protein [Chloroflexota bacterium]
MLGSHNEHVYDVVVVGAGAAGVGVAVTLMHAGIENFVVLDRRGVGSSFASWPAETRLITPSFATNSIGMLDLNSIAIGTSPAYSLEVEHPTGQDYARYLRGVARYFEVPVNDDADVVRVESTDGGFRIHAVDELLSARHVIWAAGEFQYPQLGGFEGSQLCRHTATVPSYDALDGDDFIIVGGYESGIDAAYHLAYRDKRVRVFDMACPWEEESSDPSIALAPFTHERMHEQPFVEQVELHSHTAVESVTCVNGRYEVATEDGLRFYSSTQPLLAGGFEGSHHLIAELFEQRDDGSLLLNDDDGSTITPGMFLCGPAVRHNDHIFCFIFKFRQRFAVVAKAIAISLGLPAEELEEYRKWGMYLDDLSCCGQQCAC